MTELQLLEKYCGTLELENEAKLSEIQAIYLQINSLSQSNEHLSNQLNMHINNNTLMQITITQLQQELKELQVQLEQKETKLEEKEAQLLESQNEQIEEEEEWPQEQELSNCQQEEVEDEYKEEQCRTVYCEKCLEYEKEYTKLYNEYMLKEAELEEYEESIQNNTQVQVQELIQNYEQVEQIAKEKIILNEIQQKHIEDLEHQIEIYKHQIFSKDNEIKSLGQKIFVKENRPSLTPRVSQFDLSLNQIELVKQNNRLIEKNVELEKFKNSSLIGETDRPRELRYLASLSPLRVGSKKSGYFIGSSVGKQIEKLKCENSIILESLRI